MVARNKSASVTNYVVYNAYNQEYSHLMKTKYDPVLSLRIPPDLLETLRKVAERNHRTVSQEVVRRLVNSLRRITK